MNEAPSAEPNKPADATEEHPVMPATDPADQPAPVDPDAEENSTWRPEGWVEGGTNSGGPATENPDPQHPDNHGDDAGVDENGNEPGHEAP